MKIRLMRPMLSYRRGTVLDVPDGQGNALIARGVAQAEPQGELLETAAVEVESRKADLTPRRKRRQ